jgi:hypothetical protein
MLSKARGCSALATSLGVHQICDAPLAMHQDHSESLGLHVAQRINCYKLPHKLPQIRSAQHTHNQAPCHSRAGDRGKMRASHPRIALNIIYIMRNEVCAGRRGVALLLSVPVDCHNGNAPDPTAVRPYFPTRTPAISRSPPKMPLIPGSAPKTPSISGSTSSSPLSSQLRT